MLNWRTCQICYPLEIKLIIIIITLSLFDLSVQFYFIFLKFIVQYFSVDFKIRESSYERRSYVSLIVRKLCLVTWDKSLTSSTYSLNVRCFPAP